MLQVTHTTFINLAICQRHHDCHHRRHCCRPPHAHHHPPLPSPQKPKQQFVSLVPVTDEHISIGYANYRWTFSRAFPDSKFQIPPILFQVAAHHHHRHRQAGRDLGARRGARHRGRSARCQRGQLPGEEDGSAAAADDGGGGGVVVAIIVLLSFFLINRHQHHGGGDDG
jgi:hypothetical protein